MRLLAHPLLPLSLPLCISETVSGWPGVPSVSTGTLHASPSVCTPAWLPVCLLNCRMRVHIPHISNIQILFGLNNSMWVCGWCVCVFQESTDRPIWRWRTWLCLEPYPLPPFSTPVMLCLLKSLWSLQPTQRLACYIYYNEWVDSRYELKTYANITLSKYLNTSIECYTYKDVDIFIFILIQNENVFMPFYILGFIYFYFGIFIFKTFSGPITAILISKNGYHE